MANPNAANDDKAKWNYQGEETPAQVSDRPDEQLQAPISWTASEFVEVQKGSGWHIIFFAGIILISGLLFFFTHDYIAPITIILAAIIFTFITSKKPRELPYQMDNQGIQIGNRFYKYESFKSFDLASQDGIKCINLIPLQRFMPEVSMYFPPAQEPSIVDLLSLHLPHEERAEKAMDKIARKLRF